MQKIFGKVNHADALIRAAPENQTYRNEVEIRNLFARLALPIRHFGTTGSCHVVRI